MTNNIYSKDAEESDSCVVVQTAGTLQTLFIAEFQKFPICFRKSLSGLLADLYDRFIFRINAFAAFDLANFYLYVSVYGVQSFCFPGKYGTFHTLSADSNRSCL